MFEGGQRHSKDGEARGNERDGDDDKAHSPTSAAFEGRNGAITLQTDDDLPAADQLPRPVSDAPDVLAGGLAR